MQVQRTLQTVESPQLLIEVPSSFVHQQVEIIITLDPAYAQTTPRKRRIPPAQLAGRVKELGDVMSSVSINERGMSNRTRLKPLPH